jgi:hypothetical protein
MIFCHQIVKEFKRYPHSVAKVGELLAEGRSVCLILGDHESVTTTWDDDDILAIAKKVELEPKHEDGSLAYLGWEAGGTVEKPVVAGTIAVTTRKANVELYSAFTDEELHDWLVWADEHGTSFLHAIAEAAFVSDLRDYYSLRPTLVKLKRMYPENSRLLPLPPNVKRPHDLP